MENINTVLNRASTAQQSTCTTQAGSTMTHSNTSGRERKSESDNALAYDLVNRSFVAMTSFCTAWKNAVVGDPNEWATVYKRELLESLMRVGIRTEAELRLGLARLKAKKKDFLPNPDFFAELCLPDDEELGLPTEAAAYRQATEWSRLKAADRHPAVLATMRQMDSWELRSRDEATTRKRFSEAWRKTVERVRAEGDGWLPAVPDQLEYQPPGTPAPRENARQALAGILGGL